MTDLSYSEAVEAARGAVALGPVECHTCRAWVEYAGGAWVGVGSDQLHDCAPFMAELEREVLAISDIPAGLPLGPLPTGAALNRAHPWGQRAYDEAWQREGLAPVRQAHEPEPEWVRVVWLGVAWVGGLFVAALVVAALARWANI